MRSSPHTGSELSGGEIDPRMLTGSHNGDLRENITNEFINVFFLVISFVRFDLPLPPVSAPMHVGERPTWLNSEALSRDKDNFLRKEENRPIQHY